MIERPEERRPLRLLKFHIRNYKSIGDSGPCWLASDITILAGKNESGKTNVFEALRDFDSQREIPQDAFPLGWKSGEIPPSITLTFSVTPEEIADFVHATGLSVSAAAREYLEKNGLPIEKSFPNMYRVSEEFATLLQGHTQDSPTISAIKESIAALRRDFPELTDVIEPSNWDLSFPEIRDFLIATTMPQIEARQGAILSRDPTGAQRAAQAISWLRDRLQNPVPLPNAWIAAAVERIPHIILYSDFSDIMPFELSISELESSEPLRAFAKIAGLNIQDIINATDTQARMNLLISQTALISGDFGPAWHQSSVKVVLRPYGPDRITIGLEELGDSTYYKLSQRSKGFQWFLSFYLRLNSEESENAIILIDEPGLYLHSKAQEDVLGVLQRLSAKHQMLISTHSPYLLHADRLDRIRLVIKEDNKTRIEGKIYKGTDQDTVRPIITAIGLDIIRSAVHFPGARNVLLEGISDYYFLTAMREFLSSEFGHEAALIPAVGAPSIPNLASLLIGWGLDFMAVLDTDAEGRKTRKRLRERLQLDERKLIDVHSEPDTCVEDLFTRTDFNRFVVSDSPTELTTVKNSAHAKARGIDKALASRLFLNKVRQGGLEFENQTLENFRRILRAISEYFAATPAD